MTFSKSTPMWACILLLVMGCKPQPADEGTLRRLVRKAVDSHARRVRIPPGAYRLKPPASAGAHLQFEDVDGLEIDGRGATLVMTDPTRAGVYFLRCKNMVVRGLTIDYDPICFTQGKIVRLDANGKWCEVEIENDYPASLSAAVFQSLRPMSVFDPGTRDFKDHVADIFLGGAKEIGNRTWRLLPVKEVIGRHRFPVEFIKTGDLVAIAGRGGPAWTSRYCANNVYEDITIYQCGSIAFHEQAGGGGNVYRRCRVLRRPGTSRLLSTNADGLHSKSMARGPTVEDCTFEGMHDDGVNIHGMFSRVLRTSTGRDVITSPPFEESADVGDSLEFFARGTFISKGLFRIVRREQLTDEATRALARQAWKPLEYVHGRAFRFTLDRPVSVQASDLAVSPDHSGRGFVVRGNTFRSNRYRAILIKSSKGVIEGNRIIGCTHDAIVLSPDLGGGFTEGGFVRDVTIRRNKIEHVGKLPWHRAAVVVTVYGLGDKLPPCREHRRIVIEENTITDPGKGGIIITNAKGVRIARNLFSKIGLRHGKGDRPPAVRIVQSEDVIVEGNRIAGKKVTAEDVQVDPTCDSRTIVIRE